MSVEMVDTLKKLLKNSFVLVAEDSLINQQVAEEFLNELDVAFKIVENGQEAVEFLYTQPVTLILMDLQMPVLDGFKAVEMIQMSGEFDHIPIIAMTADAEDAQKTACLENGFSDYVVKSFNSEQLYKTMMRQLG